MTEIQDNLFYFVYEHVKSRYKVASKVTGMLLETDQELILSLFNAKCETELKVYIETCCFVLYTNLFPCVLHDTKMVGEDFTLTIIEWLL